MMASAWLSVSFHAALQKRLQFRFLFSHVPFLFVALLLLSCNFYENEPPDKIVQIVSIVPPDGKAGTEVTIVGNNFSANPEDIEVFFNDAVAEVKSASPTKLIVLVPAFAGSGPVRVVVRGEESINEPVFNFTDPMVTTVTGMAGEGYQDGPLATAKFGGILYLAFDKTGNLYVSDLHNHCIRKIDERGIVTTLAGGIEGYSDGERENARFSYPSGIVLDKEGNIIVADGGNSVIRVVTPQGKVTTLAGVPGWWDGELVDGPAAQATFAAPEGVGADGAGNTYVADYGNHRIRRISADGMVSTVAGSGPPWYDMPSGSSKDGPALESILEFPSAVTVGPGGEVFFTDYTDAVRVIANGAVSTYAGGQRGFKDGLRTAAAFYNIGAIRTAPSGQVFIADRGNHRIRRLSRDGFVSTFAGTGEEENTNGPASQSGVLYPWDIAFAPNGALYISSGFLIRKIE